jgi:superfamily II DNA helicase RecQ
VIIQQQIQKLKEVSFFLGNQPHSEFKMDKTMSIFAHPDAVVGKPEIYKFLQNLSYYIYIAVDKAHCILDWGQKFRPIFRDNNQLRAVRPDARFLALLATVSISGISDITNFLGMENPQIIKTSPLRSNVSLIVLPRPDRKVSAHDSYDYIFENVFSDPKKRKEDYTVTLVYCVGINWVGHGYVIMRYRMCTSL